MATQPKPSSTDRGGTVIPTERKPEGEQRVEGSGWGKATTLGVLLAISIGTVWSCDRRIPQKQQSPRPSEPMAQAPQAIIPGESHLRLRQGIQIHQDLDPQSPVLIRVETATAAPILEARRPFYLIRIDTEEEGVITGWVKEEDGSQELRIRSRSAGPQNAVEPRPEDIARARALMANQGREESCGPYLLFTDVEDRILVEACRRLASSLDSVYTARYGVSPRGQPQEAIFLFQRRSAFRSFGGGSATYAAHADAARGYVALYQEDQNRRTVLQTLFHELTHLVNRRALGPQLPRWLSEGLADGIGDPATEETLRFPSGDVGAEAQAQRLRQAYRDGLLRPIQELASLGEDTFDQAVVSFDYEQSAFLVRFLISDHELRPRFQAYLKSPGETQSYSAELLRKELGLDWAALEQRFSTWLVSLH